MKIPELTPRSVAALVALLCCMCGCGQAVDTPTSSVRANAMEDKNSGRVDAAIAGFEHVLKSDPKDYIAHFQLAQLLQDERKDYLGAIAHFRLYLDLRPPEEKTSLAADRIEECKNMLVAEQARKNGSAPPARAVRSAPADKKQAEENARLSEEVAKLRKENENLRYLVAGLGESGKGRAAALSPSEKKMLADLCAENDEEPRRHMVIPTTTELLDDDGEDKPPLSSSEVKKQISQVKAEEASGAKRPPVIKKPVLPPDELSGAKRPPAIKKPPEIVDNSPEPDPKPVHGAARGGVMDGLLGGGKKPPAAARPSTYVVQPRETLSDIAERFYGNKNKWRDIQKANMTTISVDGRVKAGQTIKLP